MTIRKAIIHCEGYREVSVIVGRLGTSCRHILSAQFLAFHSKGRVHGLKKTWVDC